MIETLNTTDAILAIHLIDTITKMSPVIILLAIIAAFSSRLRSKDTKLEPKEEPIQEKKRPKVVQSSIIKKRGFWR